MNRKWQAISPSRVPCAGEHRVRHFVTSVEFKHLCLLKVTADVSFCCLGLPKLNEFFHAPETEVKIFFIAVPW